MKTVNRGALVVRLRQPYLDWAKSIDEGALKEAEGIENHVSVYLVEDPELLNEEEPDLETCYGQIFRQELAGWSLDESQWPRGRDLKTFRAWFDIEAQSIVVDLGRDPIEVEEDAE